ncbi:MAG TPA: hypothetical protein DCM04_07750 [Saprospirales bacterium]|nr:hypothetical protein [Saprospirales bacterium]|tara:strand:- start:370 stop:588 length:219 start_codon:yes stop_codon:yes gene_type:complete
MVAGNIINNVKCDHCGIDYVILAERADMESWVSGDKYIQEALPYLTAAERELLISKTCDKCWKKMYGIDDEE